MPAAWESSIFGCLAAPGTAIYTFFCWPCEHGRTASRLDSGSPGGICGNFCDCLFALFCPCCAVLYQRGTIKSRFGLETSPLPDCCVALCCTHCAICQHAREVKYHLSHTQAATMER